MPYIDGFLIPVKTVDRDKYRDHEAKWWPEFKKLGAQTMVQGWGDDVPAGKQTDFLRSVNLKDDETVVFAWIVYKSRKQRDAINAKVMTDPRFEQWMDPKKLPFDGKRMFWGGFKTMIER